MAAEADSVEQTHTITLTEEQLAYVVGILGESSEWQVAGKDLGSLYFEFYEMLTDEGKEMSDTFGLKFGELDL